MESSCSMSSCESLYSVESGPGEEEDEGSDVGVFLSGSESEAEKEQDGSLSPRATPDERGLFSTKAPWTSPSRLCPDRQHWMLGSAGQRHWYPPARACLTDRVNGLPGRRLSQQRLESGRKRLMRSEGLRGSPEYTATMPAHGMKRQRSREAEARQEPGAACTEGDRLFAQKCLELQGFIRPLMELLNGLKMGRYEKGLSSFQQSVAMDRIQRIIGVLQKPEMGERYLGTLLQVEMMLKVWFPRVALKSSCPEHGTQEETCKPAKPQSRPPVAGSHPGKWAARSSNPVQSPAVETAQRPDPAAAWKEQARLLADWSAMNLTWMHTSPICNPPLGPWNSAMGQAVLGLNASAYSVILFLHNNLLAPSSLLRSAPATPDKTSPACCHPKQPPGTTEPPRCQSLPGAMAARSNDLLGPRSSTYSKSLPHLPKSSKESKKATGWTGSSDLGLLAAGIPAGNC
ncbi:circadian-associated transcriptional repressor isoform X2 [Alligator sinensis]|nr:circadian-associated transcriptional repressor isoform X2 [Alligator sinensis]